MKNLARISIVWLCAASAMAAGGSLQQTSFDRSTRMLLIMPFENGSDVADLDWIGESFPEVLGDRLSPAPLLVIRRDDRLYAFERLGIPSTTRPSRATLYEIAQQMDADYVIVGSYTVNGTTLTARAQVMDVGRLKLSPEYRESGTVSGLAAIQTALAWDLLPALDRPTAETREQFVARLVPLNASTTENAALENYVRGVIATSTPEKIKRFKEALRLAPAHSLAMLQLARTYFNARQFEPAAAWFARIPQNDANANEAHFYLGLSTFYLGQLEKAESAFTWLTSRLPLTEVYNNLGVVAARRSGNRARMYFEKSVQNDPGDPDYHFNLAVALSREGNTADAIRQLRESLDIRSDAEARKLMDALAAGSVPKDSLPLERIKRNYDESSFRQLAAQIENVNEQRMINADPPTHAAFHVQRGRELQEQGLNNEALKEFREAIILDPVNADAHSQMALLLEAMQDLNGARNEARTSTRLKPSVDAYLVLARLSLTEHNPAEAAEFVDRALALDPANAQAQAQKREIGRLSGK